MTRAEERRNLMNVEWITDGEYPLGALWEMDIEGL
jgi:hypothetical protein